MKAKDLAEQLLQYPDFDVEFDIMTRPTTVDHPWAEIVSFKVCGIESIAYDYKVVVLEVDVT